MQPGCPCSCLDLVAPVGRPVTNMLYAAAAARVTRQGECGRCQVRHAMALPQQPAALMVKQYIALLATTSAAAAAATAVVALLPVQVTYSQPLPAPPPGSSQLLQ